MRLLITGSTGFIGNRLAKYFHDKGYEVHLVIRKNSPRDRINFISEHFIHIHDGSSSSLLQLFDNYKFDAIVHCAGLVLPSHSINELEGLIKSNILFSSF